jgi:hypothetical protein
MLVGTRIFHQGEEYGFVGILIGGGAGYLVRDLSKSGGAGYLVRDLSKTWSSI